MNNIKLLQQCDEAYFNGEESPLTDLEYDILKAKEWKNSPSDAYFVSIGSSERTGKIKLPYTMGSLNQIYENDAKRWVNTYSLENSNLIVSDKLDGTSIMIVYNNGTLSIAYSRGNGVEGADVTRHVHHIPSIPKSISTDYNYLVVRAECIMKNSTFNSKYSEESKNPRNMVAGMMNRKKSDIQSLNDIEIVCYEIVDIRGIVSMPLTKQQSLDILKSLGFSVVNHTSCVGRNLNDEYLSKLLLNSRTNSDYELDGLVVSVDDVSKLESMSSANTLNPEHSVKYKVLDESSIVDAYVVDVLWEISKSAYIKPRVEIVPVELNGTTVRYASGFNAKFIIDNGIGKGAKIRITKAGAVIPDIIGVVHGVTPTLPPESLGEWQLNETGVDAELVDKLDNRVIFKQVLDFFGTYKIDLLKEANLRTVWNALDVKDYDDAIVQICDLSRVEWYKIIGVNGERIYDSIQQRLGNSLPETFIGACAHMGIGFGVRKARSLLEFPFSKIRSITMEDLDGIEGFADKTARQAINGIPLAMSLADTLISNGVLKFVESQKTSEMSAVNVVMTGFRDADLQSIVESKGGKVGSGVSKKTTHLLTYDTESNSGKAKKARDLGVPIITPEEFKIIHGI